ncbi:hypothetical protein KEM48_005328 [Puccinia striiformis f. sp. tritici PST-130]|nr:hypothetical protein KEM48_005328 [Puccinia striiformis f. sp. tritici PST-130]
MSCSSIIERSEAKSILTSPGSNGTRERLFPPISYNQPLYLFRLAKLSRTSSLTITNSRTTSTNVFTIQVCTFLSRVALAVGLCLATLVFYTVLLFAQLLNPRHNITTLENQCWQYTTQGTSRVRGDKLDRSGSASNSTASASNATASVPTLPQLPTLLPGSAHPVKI